MQIVLIDLRLRQQRSHPQRARRILCPQKLKLPHRRLQRLRIMQLSPLLRQQLRHCIHAVRSVHIPRRLMVDRPKSIHRPRIVRPRPSPHRYRLERLQSALRLLPGRQLHLALRRLCRQLRYPAAQHDRATQHRRATPAPPAISNCRSQAHCLLNSTDSLKFKRPRTPGDCEKNPGTPPDTPRYSHPRTMG